MLSENERPEESLVGTDIWLNRNLDSLDTNKVSAQKKVLGYTKRDTNPA